MSNSAQSSFFCRHLTPSAADPVPTPEHSPDKAVEADDRPIDDRTGDDRTDDDHTDDDRTEINAFNTFYQEFTGSPIAICPQRRRFTWPPVLTKIILAGASGLVTAIVVIYALVQAAPKSNKFTFQEPVSFNPQSIATPQLTPSESESIAALPRRIQPSRRAATAKSLHLPQIAPPASIAVMPFKTEPASVAPVDRLQLESALAVQPIAAPTSSASVVAPAPTAASTSAAHASRNTIRATAQWIATATPIDRFSLDAPDAAPASVATPETTSSASDRAANQFSTLAEQTVRPQLELSDRAAPEVEQSDQIGDISAGRLSQSANRSF